MDTAAVTGFFDDAYQQAPPWEIGRPQKAVVALEEGGKILGSVLDVGCGTGENALHLANRGHDVVGIDGSAGAISIARAKAVTRGQPVQFRLGDALALSSLQRSFDTILDSGLFHVFSDEDRPRYVRSLASVLRPGGIYYVICFSELEPEWGGPRRVTQQEIRDLFADGWSVENIEPSSYVNKRSIGGEARAWVARIRYTPVGEESK